jgi:hypothetical protein
MIRLILWRANLGPQRVAILRGCGLKVWHSDCHVIEPSDHPISPIWILRPAYAGLKG